MTFVVGDYRRYHFHLMAAMVYHQKDRQVVVGEEVLEHFQRSMLEMGEEVLEHFQRSILEVGAEDHVDVVGRRSAPA